MTNEIMTEFADVFKDKLGVLNGIVHRHVPPYHPSSNGLAENMAKTVKQALSKSKLTKEATIETHIAHFLFSYRNTCHAQYHFKDTCRVTLQSST